MRVVWIRQIDVMASIGPDPNLMEYRQLFIDFEQLFSIVRIVGFADVLAQCDRRHTVFINIKLGDSLNAHRIGEI